MNNSILSTSLSFKVSENGLAHLSKTLSDARNRDSGLVRQLMMRRNRFADLHRRLLACPARLIENAKHRFNHIEGMLRVLGPDATLRRGHSITMNDRGQIIRTTGAVRTKMKIRTRVSDGEFGSKVL